LPSKTAGIFSLPCEYLCVFSPAADVQAARRRGDPTLGRDMNIARITPVYKG
jgi:hypothetical protein